LDAEYELLFDAMFAIVAGFQFYGSVINLVYLFIYVMSCFFLIAKLNAHPAGFEPRTPPSTRYRGRRKCHFS
jgi:hypothetical protein